jgi:hypothetical protein
MLLLARRLWRLWRETGRAPERWLALFFAGLAVGIPSRVIGVIPDLVAPALQSGFGAFGHLAFALGIAALYGFTRSAFRAEVGWARWLSLAGVTAVGVTTGWVLLAPEARAELHPAVIAANSARVLPFLWPFFECTHHARLMARRREVGLADPVVANRFALWAVWTGALGIFGAVVVAVRLWALSTGSPITGNPEQARWLVPPIVVTGCIVAAAAATAVWLSFFPPKRYLRWLQREAEA